MYSVLIGEIKAKINLIYHNIKKYYVDMMHENNKVAISAFPVQNEYRYLINKVLNYYMYIYY